MPNQTKILIVDSDLDNLSRIYLSLVHRKYKVEATDKPSEIFDRMKRWKPSILVLGQKEYLALGFTTKIPLIILLEHNEQPAFQSTEEMIGLEKPVHMEQLMKAIEALVI